MSRFQPDVTYDAGTINNVLDTGTLNNVLEVIIPINSLAPKDGIWKP